MYNTKCFYLRVFILLIYARKENINNWNRSIMQMLHGSRFTEEATGSLTPFCCRFAQAAPHPDQVFPRLAHEPRGPGEGQGEGEGGPGQGLMLCSAPSVSQSVFTVTEKAPTRAFSWLKVPITAFTF